MSAEQVVLKLCQIEVQTAQGKSLAIACREAEISEQSYYRWRKEYGGLQIDQARRMKELERKNVRLRRLVVREAGSGGRRLGKLLYSGFSGQRPFVRTLVRRVIGPVELLLLSKVGRCRLMMGLEGCLVPGRGGAGLR